MALLIKAGHIEGAVSRSMDFTTITYYSVSKSADTLAVVRYTAYDGGSPIAVCEGHYGDTPEVLSHRERR